MTKDPQIIETEQDDKPSFFNMRRLFPDADKVKEMDFNEYARVSRKVLKKELQQAPFFFHTEFEFMGGEIGPFLYIGQITPTWKKLIKTEYRLLKEFAAGICSFNEDTQVLELQVQMGKGQKNSNLKELQKRLMRKWKVDVVFSLGTTDQEPGFKEAELGEKVAEQEAKLDKKISTLQAIDLREEQFVAQSHTIAGVIRTELDNLKKIPRENADQIMEKALLIQQLIQQWYAKFGNVHGEERKAEKQFIESVEKILNAQVLNEKSLNALRVKEFVNEWKNCLRSKKQIGLFVQQISQPDTQWDPDDAQEERDTMIKDLLDELDYLDQDIVDWSKQEPQAYKQNEAMLQEIRKKIEAERGELRKKFPAIAGTEHPAKKELDELSQKAQGYKTKFQQLVKAKAAGKADDKAGSELFVQLKKFDEELRNFAAFRKEYLDTSAAKTLKAAHKRLLEETLQQCNELRKNKLIEERVDVNDYRVLEFEKGFEQAKTAYDNLKLTVKTASDKLEKDFQQEKTAAGDDQDKLKTAEDKRKTALKDLEQSVGAKVFQISKQLDQIKTEIRLWMKEQQENGRLTSGDDKRIQTLRARINDYYGKLENALSPEMRQEMQDRQTLSPKALAELSTRTRLPENLPEPAITSKVYNKIHKKYKEYQAADDEDLEKKRYLLQTICSMIDEWDKKHPDGESKNKEAIQTLRKVAYRHLEVLSQFGESRNAYYEIISRYERIKPLLEQMDSLNQKQTDQLQYEFIKIDDLIDEWHALNVHLSGFGTNQQSKRLAAIRAKIRSLAPTFLGQTAKQNLIADLGNRAIGSQANTEDQIKAAAFACIEAASREKSLDHIKQVELAIQAGNKIAQKKGLDAKALKNAIEENWGDTALLRTSLGNLNVVDELDDLAQNFKELNQEANQVGTVFRSRLTYDAADDLVFKKLNELMKTLGAAVKDDKLVGSKKSFLKNWEDFQNQANYWEAIIESYEDNENGQLATNKKELKDFKTTHEAKLKEKADAIEGVRTAREGVKQAKSYHKNAQRTVKEIQTDLAKLEKQKGKESKEYLDLSLILTEHKMHLFNSLSNIQEQSKEYEENFQKLPKNLQETKHKQKEHLELGSTSSQGEYAKAHQALQTEFPESNKDKKKQAYEKIIADYNNYQNSLKGNTKPSKTEREKTVLKLQLSLNEWNQILIYTQDEALKKELEAQTKRMKDIQTALLLEADKLKVGDNDPIYKERPDALFQAIEKQHQQLKTANQPAAENVLALKKMADAWAASHTQASVQDQSRFETLKTIQTDLDTWLRSPNLKRQACLLLIEEQAQVLTARLKPYRSMPEMANHQGLVDTAAQTLKQKIQDLKDQESITDPALIQKALDQIKAWLAEQESEWLQIQAEQHRKEEQLTLAALDGMDVYADLSNIAIDPETRKAEILKAAQSAVDRAMKMIELECYDKAELMVAHIPVAFWPDELIEEMRLWKKIQDTFLNEPSEEMIEKKFEDSSIGKLIESTIEFGGDLSDAYDDIGDDFEDWGKKLKELKDDGLITEQETKMAQFFAQKMGIKAMDLDAPEEEESVGSKVLSGFLAAKGIVVDVAKTAGELISAINELTEMPKYDIKGGKKFKQALLISSLVNSTLSKALGQADSFLDASSDSAEPIKIAASVIKGVKGLLDFGAKFAEAAKDKDARSIGQFFKAQLTSGNLEAIADGLLDLGQTAGDITSLFTEVGGVVSSAFELVGDVKQVIKDIRALVKTCQDKKKTAVVLNRAAQMDSVMLGPLRREMTVAKRNVAKASVDLAGDAVKMIGTGIGFAGNIATLVPEGHTQAAGYGLKIAGKVVQVVGKTIKIAGKVVFTAIEDSEKRKVKKLLELAKKDRNARMEILEKSSLYAKMALVVGLLDQDPIAVEYCIARGLTEKDLDGATAYKILQRMTELTKDNLDDKTSWEHVKDKVGGNLKKVTGHFKNVHQFVNQTKTIDASSPKTLKAAMSEVTAAMSSLKIHKYGSIVGGVILGVVTLSVEGYDVVKSHLDSQMQECTKTLNELKKKLGERKTAISDEIDQLIQQMQPLNTRIEQGEMSLSLSNQLLDLDQQIQQKKAFLKALHEAQNTLEGFKQQFQ
jgi:hypothetical protein